MFKYLKDVISGRIKHWNETNNVVVTELWNRLEAMRNPSTMTLKHFLVAAGIVVDRLMGFERQMKVKAVIDIPCRKVSIEQFRQLYCILLSYFTFLFCTSNPHLKEEKKEALYELIDQPELAKKLLSSLDKIGKADMSNTAFEVWNNVVETIGFGQKDDFLQALYLMGILKEPYKGAVDNIKAELDF